MIKGKILFGGNAEGEALVFKVPFSFIGDMDPENGEITMANHALRGSNLKGKVLVTTTGHGGTIAPFIAYLAQKNNCNPVAILCNHADSLTLECAIVMGVPIIDDFNLDITEILKTGDRIKVYGQEGCIEIAS